MNIPNDKKTDLPVERKRETGSTPHEKINLVDHQLHDWVLELSKARPKEFDRFFEIVKEIKSHGLVHQKCLGGGVDHDSTYLVTFQHLIESLWVSITDFGALHAKLSNAEDNEDIWFRQAVEQIRIGCESRKLMLASVKAMVEARKNQAMKLYDIFKKVAARKEQEMHEPAEKKRKVETRGGDGLKSDELAFADGLWEKLVDHDDDVRILGEFMTGIDKRGKTVVSMLLRFWNELKRKQWKTFEAYSEAMKALGARMDVLTDEQSGGIWKTQMEARKKMLCFEGNRPMPVFTYAEYCQGDSDSD